MKKHIAETPLTERQVEILRTVREAGGNFHEAARRLGIGPSGVRQTVFRCRMKKTAESELQAYTV